MAAAEIIRTSTGLNITANDQSQNMGAELRFIRAASIILFDMVGNDYCSLILSNNMRITLTVSDPKRGQIKIAKVDGVTPVSNQDLYMRIRATL